MSVQQVTSASKRWGQRLLHRYLVACVLHTWCGIVDVMGLRLFSSTDQTSQRYDHAPILSSSTTAETTSNPEDEGTSPRREAGVEVEDETKTQEDEDVSSSFRFKNEGRHAYLKTNTIDDLCGFARPLEEDLPPMDKEWTWQLFIAGGVHSYLIILPTAMKRSHGYSLSEILLFSPIY